MLRLTFVLALLVHSLPSLASLENRLQDHPSPYLAMHGQDPVHWQDWSRETLDRAKVENKPLFISSGYFACHWCHVMQRESYQDASIAELLNQYFIPVKVDRELHPALDDHLIEFVRRTRGQAGWPLNVFLTPEGYPLVGLTYSPADGFRALLLKLSGMWEVEADKLKAMAEEGGKEMAAVQSGPTAMEIEESQRLRSALIEMALLAGDDMEGGFGRQNRFPMAPQLSVLLRQLQQGGQEQLRELLSLTLEQMASQGLRDHIGGGFFRYTVDPGWQIPHFEKMLYTQALLIQLYLQAAETLSRPDYLDIAGETLDFALRELRGQGGGFIASLSAVDPDNREGGGYLWSNRQLRRVLEGSDLEFARKRWRLQGDSALDEGWLPVKAMELTALAAGLDRSEKELSATEQRVKQRLLQARAVRSHPRDDKQLAAWNGLMLSALAKGVERLPRPRYRQAGEALRGYLVGQLWDGSNLLRARAKGDALGSAALEDYAYVAAGLFAWSGLTGSASDLKLIQRLAEDAWKRFYTPAGWQATDDLMLPGLEKEPVLRDGPLPSAAATLIRLSFDLGEPQLVARAKRALALGHGRLRQQPLWHATQIQALLDAEPLLAQGRMSVEGAEPAKNQEAKK